MSTWIHCNRCCAMGANGGSFWLTSCGHIICDSCQKISGTMPGQKGPCVICKLETGIMQINHSMRPNILAMFRPPKDIVAECNRRMNTMIEFQATQSQLLIKQLNEKLTKAAKFAHAAKAEIAKRGENMQLLVAERNQLISELKKAEEYGRQLENRLAEREQELQRLKHQQHKSPRHLGTPCPYKKDHRFPNQNGDTPMTSRTFFRNTTRSPYQNPYITADIFPGSRHPFLGNTPQPNLNLQNLLDTPTMSSSTNTNNAPMMIAPDPTPNFYPSASQMMERTPTTHISRYF